ncbi:MAG: rod shape-determining protein MreD [Synechococcus sp. TMED90]|nr:MAG: rod shape-determining protein MreD [Synechococcus sp. TMED90]
MARLHRQPICVASALLVPLLQLVAPFWLALDGVGPSWAMLWLLPWALVDGPVSGGIAGAALGLVLDGLSLGDVSQVPALVLMGWWWGRIGRRGPPIQRSFNIGLLALIGTVVQGLSLWLQLLVLGSSDALLQAWALHTTLAQALITGLLAPMVGSWQLLLWRRRAPA